jgi:CheY-like chemotaxis protein/anti-sigma regulatory factor (Ser/Thr protein kinase)
MQKRQLDEANRLKTAFLSNMSHELRTPLNSVIALAGVLNRRLAKKINDVEYGYLEIIERNGKNLLSLINDILDLSRIEAGKEELGLSRFPVRTLINETVSILQPLADEKGLVLRQEVPGDLPLMNSDFDKCRHILQNLLANAVKFTDQGEVTITAEYEPGSIRNTKSEIRISVADSGIGIPADQVPLIFQEFRQVDDGISRKYGGTGLGLAIAQKYAALLQGRIEVESTLGQGSTFTLILPLKLERRARITFNQEPEPLSGRSKEAAQAKVAPFQGLSILLVEDNEAAVIQMTDILSDQGYDLRVARNGKEALEQIETALPSAMILDLMMPEVDGFQVLAAIRKKEKTAHIPVLILTAKHITPEELTFLKGNHIYQLIQKGDINRAELLKAVAEMITPSPKESKEDPRELKQVLRSGKPVILVVEDNVDNMKTVLALLDDKGVILEAYDGPEGLDLAQKHRPDLILLDIALPRMDGFTVLERIREDETLKHIPVIALTASAMKGDREEILARGFDGYLSKPLDLEYFEEMLQEVIYADQLS